MKNIFIYTAILSGLIFSGCNDSFLDRYPKTSLTEQNAFTSYDNFKTFMWPCYNIFTNNTIGTSVGHRGQESHYLGDVYAGYLENKNVNGFNKYAFQTVGSVASGNGWDFSAFIRRTNLMLSHIDDSTMSPEEKDHWKAVGYFFHSYWYMELIDRFGDVPWVDKLLNENSEELQGKREPRKTVADKVLERLKWAEEHIGDFSAKDGPNTISQDCIRAALSRFALREATWRKYHEMGDYDAYLDECIRVSALLMDDYPTLYEGTDGQPAAGYGEMWTTEDLGKVPGIILYKEYAPNINATQLNYYEHTSAHWVEMNQATVDLYLMKNGKPITNGDSEYEGDRDMYSTFRNRDPRLYHTVIPPYKIKEGKGEYPTWSYTGNLAVRATMYGRTTTVGKTTRH